MKKVYSLLMMLIVAVTSSWAVTLYSYTPNTDQNTKDTEYAATGGTATLGAAKVEAIGFKSDNGMNSTKYIKVALTGNTLQAGDVVTINAESGSSNGGIYIATTKDADGVASGEGANYVDAGTLSAKNTAEDLSYTVTSSDCLNGKSVFYLFRNGADSSHGVSTYIKSITVSRSRTVTSKVLTGININGEAWDISGLDNYAATITTAYTTVPVVEFVYQINYDSGDPDTGQIEEITSTKDGDNYVAASTVLTNNVTLTFTNVTAKALPELSYTETAVNKYTTDANFTNELTNPHDLAVTYSVEEGATATGVEVDATTGEVTIGSVPGTATIKASFAGDDTYEAGNASYTLTVTQPTCAVPTYTLGSYNYEQEGYEIVASCTTDGATLSYKIGSGDFIECTNGEPFYAKGGKLVIKASKEGYQDATIASGSQWTLNGAPSSTSPESLIPFQTTR